MKIAISYPPLESKKGVACLSQNRQFQWLSRPTYIYPVIPAYAASLLKESGYGVLWDDAIAEEISYEEWKRRIIREKPDIIAIETKTPVVKRHWKIIDELKEESYKVDKVCKVHKEEVWNPKIVLMGDHVTALPEESLDNSKVDYVIASGDYDFMLLNLANYLLKGEALEGGFWFRDKSGRVTSSGRSDLSKHDLNTLPLINRELTRWKSYAYKNGNFKHKPGAYMMSARDCWWGKCSFCSWTTMFPGNSFRTMSAEKALDEVGNLIKLGAKEIMEDSGTLPIGKWLKEFCEGMIREGYDKKIKISCNMRINAIKNPATWKLMKRAGFRMILFGLESANQETLDKINKNLKVSEIEPGLRRCRDARLEPHITAMAGYPWETEEMAQRTVNLAKKLFKQGLIDTLQGTIVIPYPGTPLYKYCEENNLLLTKKYEDYDQRQAVIKSPLSSEEALKLVRGLYKSFASPQFVWRKIKSIKSPGDVKFLFVSGWKWLGKMADFGKH